MNTSVLRRFKELGGDDLVSRLIDLHIHRSTDVMRQIKTACVNNRFDQARHHTSRLKAFVEEVGQEQVIPVVGQLQNSLAEGTLAEVRRDLHRLSEAVRISNRNLTRAKGA